MADNYTIDGIVYASDDISSVHWPRVKVTWGVDGAAVDASATNPLPVGGSSASSLGKAIDAVAGASDVGIAGLMIRDDALSAVTPIEGDWIPHRGTSTGAMWVALADPPDVNVLTMPADDRTNDSTSAALATDVLMNNQVEMTTKRANVSLAADGTIIAAVASKQIQIHALDIDNPSGVTFQIDDGSGGTRMMGPYTKSRVVNFSPAPWAKGTTNTLVHYNLTSGAGTVSITAIYTEA